MKSFYNFIAFAYILHFLHIEVAMLNYVWSFIVVLSVICSIILGNSNDLSTAFIDSAASAIELIITSEELPIRFQGKTWYNTRG